MLTPAWRTPFVSSRRARWALGAAAALLFVGSFLVVLLALGTSRRSSQSSQNMAASAGPSPPVIELDDVYPPSIELGPDPVPVPAPAGSVSPGRKGHSPVQRMRREDALRDRL